MDWTQRLRVRQLTILVALYESRNLSKTASRMAMTQPALSKWLREIEGDLAVPLFERHSRGLVPTPYCEVLVARARLVLNELDRTAELLRVMSDGLSGKLHVGTTPIAVTEILPTALAAFRKSYPNASVSVIDDLLDHLLPRLRDGSLDFIVSRLEDRDYGGDVAQERLYAEHIAVIAGTKHPLASKRKVTWKDALSFPWVAPPANSPLHRELEHEIALANQPFPRVVIEASSMVLIVTVLEHTDMLAVLSGRPAKYFQALHRLRILPIGIQRQNYVGVLWRKNSLLGELESGFLHSLRQAVTPEEKSSYITAVRR